MPIILPKLPIAERIKLEGIHVIGEEEYLQHKGIQTIEEDAARRQDIRPMEIVVLNLMPDKQGTEEQLARLLGHTPLQVRLTLLRTGTYQSKNESAEHLAQFYRTWNEISDRQFDGLIVTGAPVEHLPWIDVQYWKELGQIFNWAKQNVYSRLYICWGAQAALQQAYGIEKHPLAAKAFGIFPHTVRDWRHPLVEGFDDEFLIPVSRHTEIRKQDIEAFPELQILCESKQTGIHLIQHSNSRDTYMFNHPEYTANTLRSEYARDVDRHLPIRIPENYFPADNPQAKPVNRWRAHGRIFYGNWLRQMYQNTPYDLRELRTMQDDAPVGDMVEV